MGLDSECDGAHEPDPEDCTAAEDSVDVEPCASCGAAIYEAAGRCPECGAWVVRPGRSGRLTWLILVIGVLLAFAARALR